MRQHRFACSSAALREYLTSALTLLAICRAGAPDTLKAEMLVLGRSSCSLRHANIV